MAERQMQRTMEIDNNLMSWQFAIAEVKAGHENGRVAMKVGADLLKGTAEEAGESEPQPPQPQLQGMGA